MTVYRHTGQCHCGAIDVVLETSRAPHEQVLGACQCTFCRKHNVRAFSDPGAYVELTANVPELVTHYRFGLETSSSVICRRCGLYVAMVIAAEHGHRCTLNIDALEQREAFCRQPTARDYSAETASERIARRRKMWTPVRLINWRESV